jgi:hypothetical protein
MPSSASQALYPSSSHGVRQQRGPAPPDRSRSPERRPDTGYRLSGALVVGRTGPSSYAVFSSRSI